MKQRHCHHLAQDVDATTRWDSVAIEVTASDRVPVTGPFDPRHIDSAVPCPSHCDSAPRTEGVYEYEPTQYPAGGA